MHSIRLFADLPLEPGHEVGLPSAAAAHALRVLRLKTGDTLTLFNGDGHEYAARLVATSLRDVRAAVDSRSSPLRESPLRMTLIQSLARGEKMDWIIQKATELGAARIVPVSTERSEVKLDPTRSGRRHAHWQAIAISACEQCGRNRLPRIDVPLELAAWLESDPAAEPAARWMLCPGGAARLREVHPGAVLQLAVGPEGGFGEADHAVLLAHGFRELSLGPRILRTETAGIAALAALQAFHGDF